ncbi:MAG TPA: NADP-specific glutamate dehydrogenase [Solirubrobacterales bacterium]|nr:NADP-specific glutamate dehydrogenase [Solirubrobacterales bacterium]
MSDRLEEFMAGLEARNPGEEVFHQAVRMTFADVIDEYADHEEIDRQKILERMTEPDRTVMFRVVWQTDEGEFVTNRAYRVQFNNSIGPYKGGLRFVRGLELGTLKFLGFEQTFKNALTGLPMGGARGGSDFDPKGRSDSEVMRFCQSMMVELHHYIGEDVDVPAGDIGVGEREIAYLFGQYKRLAGRFAGILTGKGLSFGGSAVRSEATGYGVAYFTALMLDRHDGGLDGKVCTISGSGNVSIFCAEKLIAEGAKVISLSDSDGTIHDPEGIDESKLEWVKDLKLVRKGRIGEYADEFDCEYLEGEAPWGLECDIAFPSATENELDEDAAKTLSENGCEAVVEGANMPLTHEATEYLRSEGVLIGPAKAANAGGVAVSGLEQSQNAARTSWSREEVDQKLRDIMKTIHADCVEKGEGKDGKIDYVRGANLAGFERVAEAMLAHGAV